MCSMSPSTASNTPPPATDACAVTTWLGSVQEDGTARSRMANKSSIYSLLRADLGRASPQITVTHLLFGVSASPEKSRIGFFCETTSGYVSVFITSFVRQWLQFMRQLALGMFHTFSTFGTESGAD